MVAIYNNTSQVNFGTLEETLEVFEDDMYIIQVASDGTIKKVKAVNTEEKIGAFGYISTPAATTITTTGTYYELQGTFTNTLLDNFTVTTSGIMYTGNNPLIVEVQWHAGFTADTNNPEITIGFALNGTFESCSAQSIQLKLAGQYSSLSGVCVNEVNHGDTIQIQATADKSIELTAQAFQTSLQKFY